MSRIMKIACLLVAMTFGLAGVAQAQNYTLQPGSGGQGAIGNGLPLPIQSAMSPMGGQFGTGTLFPPLLIPPNPLKWVAGTGAAGPGQTLKVPIAAFRRVPTAPKFAGVAKNNPTVWQVRTNLQFSGPGFSTAASTTGAPGGGGGAQLKKSARPGLKTTTYSGIPSNGNATIRYSNSVNRFGGSGQSKVLALTPVLVWAHSPGVVIPCKHPALGGSDPGCVSALLAAHPASKVAAGGPADNLVTTPGGPPPKSPNAVVVSIPNTTGMIGFSASAAMSGTLTNMASSEGFPFTTGMLTISQFTALASPEVFKITGGDARTAGGLGTVSLVAGALSNRTISGPNSNRTWSRYVLPEPTAVLGAAAALGVLGICHGLVRRRR